MNTDDAGRICTRRKEFQLKKNWTSHANARECMRTISKFSIDVFNARKRLDVGLPLFTLRNLYSTLQHLTFFTRERTDLDGV